MKKIFIALMLCAASVSTWALDLSNSMASSHITKKTVGVYTQLTIKMCSTGCRHTLKQILNAAQITEDDHIDLIRFGTYDVPAGWNTVYQYSFHDEIHKIVESFPNLKAYTIDLRKVKNVGSWKNLKNQYLSNLLLQYDEHLGLLDNSVVENFNPDKLYNVISLDACHPCQRTEIDAYVNKPGFLAYGLQYITEVAEEAGFGQYSSWEQKWWNKGTPNGGNGYTYWSQAFTKVRLSGYVFARDIMADYNTMLTPEGHMPAFSQEVQYQDGFLYRPGQKCPNPLAPSYNDPNTIYFSASEAGHQQIGAMLGSHVTSFDFTNAQFGEWKEENGKKVFKYYPADMTISMLQELGKDFDANGKGGSVVELKLPTSPTQYVIPEGFLRDSKYIKEICIPSNFTEIGRFAFLGAKGQGIHHFTTTATEVDEQKQLFNGIKKGDIINYGDSTLTLPSTTKFVGRGAFSGYDGAALLLDVYVLAENAPYCEFYAFDQKTYVGDNFHHQGHLIKKGNYVGANMAMLHFPNTTSRIEMLNYSDMTRKYRLYDETGHYDNVGNILVWPTQAQYNRSFNQALAGVTWWAWKENLNGVDDPENAYSAGAVAGGGYQNANHEYVFSKAASDDGFSDKFTVSFDGENPNSSFDPNEGKGQGFNSNQAHWDEVMLAKSVPASETDRPLSYNWVNYGGWHQFVITELYDFLLDDPTPGPRPDYFNFAKYNKNIWYTICFPFNLTKAQLLKAFGNPETGEYPVLSTLAGVTRDAEKLGITVHMSKDLVKNKILYDENYTVKADLAHGKWATYNEGIEYGDDDIVVEANMPYFILPCLPEEELVKAATGYRRCEITTVKDERVMFPIATRVHAVNGKTNSFVNGQDANVNNNTSYTFNYYFVGNYIPQTMPENAYYLNEYQKKNGEYWSSFYRNQPVKTGLMWDSNDAIVIAKVDDASNAHAKGALIQKQLVYNGTDHNYVWDVTAYNDWVFFAETGHEAYTKSAFGLQVNDNFTTSIELPEDMEDGNAGKVYNLNGQFVGIDTNKMAKGIYIVGGKKIVK